MEKEDQLIKDLLKEGFLTKAPEGFTGKVMQAVAEKEEAAVREYPVWLYFTFIAATLVTLTGILFFTNKAFLVKFFTYFSGLFNGLTPTFSMVFEAFTNFSFNLPYNGLLFGTAGIVLLLLAFDKFLFRRKRFIGIFSI